MPVFVSFKKKNVSQRGLGSHRPHGTTAGLKKTTDFHSIKLGLKSSCTNYRQNILGQGRGTAELTNPYFSHSSQCKMSESFHYRMLNSNMHEVRSRLNTVAFRRFETKETEVASSYRQARKARIATFIFWLCFSAKSQRHFSHSLFRSHSIYCFAFLQLVYSFKFVFNASF